MSCSAVASESALSSCFTTGCWCWRRMLLCAPCALRLTHPLHPIQRCAAQIHQCTTATTRYVLFWIVAVAAFTALAHYVSAFPSRRRTARAQARMRMLLKHRVFSSTGRAHDKETSLVSSMLRKVLLPEHAVVLRSDLFGPSDLTTAASPNGGADSGSDTDSSSDHSSDRSSGNDDDGGDDDHGGTRGGGNGSSHGGRRPLADARASSENELSRFYKQQSGQVARVSRRPRSRVSSGRNDTTIAAAAAFVKRRRRKSSHSDRRSTSSSSSSSTSSICSSGGGGRRREAAGKGERTCTSAIEQHGKSVMKFLQQRVGQRSPRSSRAGGDSGAAGTSVSSGADGPSSISANSGGGGGSDVSVEGSGAMSPRAAGAANHRLNRKRQIVVPEKLPKGCEPVIVFINSLSGGGFVIENGCKYARERA